MITEEREEVFIQASESSTLKVVAVVAALAVTALLVLGYAYIRKRHAQTAEYNQQPAVAEPRLPAQAVIEVDEALLQGGNSLLGGTVRNISNEKLSNLSVELELKRRDAQPAERKTVPLNPPELEPSQEGRYSLQLKAQEYLVARVVALHSGSDAALVRYTLSPGAKRPAERLETKTITVGKPKSKPGEFLNSPDNPARVP